MGENEEKKYTITLVFDPASGGLRIETDVKSQIVGMGMLSMAMGMFGRSQPRPSKIEAASAIPAGLPTPGHS